MNKDEMKNRISMALKDPILQKGFEIICKENAELKEKLKPENCLKLLAKDGYVKFTSDQLTKAKDHIKKLLDCLKQDTNDPETNYYVCKYMDEAEQFLKEIEK